MNRRSGLETILLAVLAMVLVFVLPASRADDKVTDIGQNLELFVDRHHIASMDGVQLALHPPRPAEVAVRFDKPWEGPYSAYVTVFRDDDLYRMYYRGWADLNGDQLTCYAESPDGITWTKPKLGLVAFQDSTENNIVLRMPGLQGTHNFAPFRDDRPGVPDDARYKALGGQPPYAFASADALHWRRLDPKPVMTKGAFDSQNLAFWNPQHNAYNAYFRIIRDRVRAIATSSSEDFLTWSEPTPLDVGDGPKEHFYTNATTPYFRARLYLHVPQAVRPRSQAAAEP